MADMWQFLAQKKPTNGKYEPVPLYFLKDRDWEKDQGQTGTVGNVPGCGISTSVNLGGLFKELSINKTAVFFRIPDEDILAADLIVEADRGQDNHHRLVRPPRMKRGAFIKIFAGLPWQPLTLSEARQRAEEEK